MFAGTKGLYYNFMTLLTECDSSCETANTGPDDDDLEGPFTHYTASTIHSLPILTAVRLWLLHDRARRIPDACD